MAYFEARYKGLTKLIRSKFPVIEPQLANTENQFTEQAAASLFCCKSGRRKSDSYYGVVFLGAVEG